MNYHGGSSPFGQHLFGQQSLSFHGSPYSHQQSGVSGSAGGGATMNTAITNQKPKKVIYIDLQGNQKVFTQREDAEGYVEDSEDGRNRNAAAVRPILDVENYDGFNYHPAPDDQL